MPTVDEILAFEEQFDACLVAMFGPLLQPFNIPFVPYHQTLGAVVPRLQGRFQAGTQDINRGTIQAVYGSRTTAQSFGGQIILDLLTRRDVQDPKPTMGLIRSWMLPKYDYLNTNLQYLEVVALDMMDSKRGIFDEGKERADISTVVYQLVFRVQPQYQSLLTT